MLQLDHVAATEFWRDARERPAVTGMTYKGWTDGSSNRGDIKYVLAAGGDIKPGEIVSLPDPRLYHYCFWCGMLTYNRQLMYERMGARDFVTAVWPMCTMCNDAARQVGRSLLAKEVLRQYLLCCQIEMKSQRLGRRDMDRQLRLRAAMFLRQRNQRQTDQQALADLLAQQYGPVVQGYLQDIVSNSEAQPQIQPPRPESIITEIDDVLAQHFRQQ
ncbi:hypothetical protein IPG36_03925 [bacterium]|nr:MAG: hypothetical protein IPG36_03925 [bacterium]